MDHCAVALGALESGLCVGWVAADYGTGLRVAQAMQTNLEAQRMAIRYAHDMCEWILMRIQRLHEAHPRVPIDRVLEVSRVDMTRNLLEEWHALGDEPPQLEK